MRKYLTDKDTTKLSSWINIFFYKYTRGGIYVHTHCERDERPVIGITLSQLVMVIILPFLFQLSTWFLLLFPFLFIGIGNIVIFLPIKTNIFEDRGVYGGNTGLFGYTIYKDVISFHWKGKEIYTLETRINPFSWVAIKKFLWTYNNSWELTSLEGKDIKFFLIPPREHTWNITLQDENGEETKGTVTVNKYIYRTRLLYYFRYPSKEEIIAYFTFKTAVDYKGEIGKQWFTVKILNDNNLTESINEIVKEMKVTNTSDYLLN